MPARANTAAPAQPHHSPPAPIANPATVNSAHKPASRSRRSGVGSAPARRNMRSRPFRGVRSARRSRSEPYRRSTDTRGAASKLALDEVHGLGLADRAPPDIAPVGIRRFDRLRATTWRAGALVDEPVAAFELAGDSTPISSGRTVTILPIFSPSVSATTDRRQMSSMAQARGTSQRSTDDPGKEQQLGPIHVADPSDHLLVEQGGSIEMDRRLSRRPVRRLIGGIEDRIRTGESGDRPRPPG